MNLDPWDILVVLGVLLIFSGTWVYAPGAAVILLGVFFLAFGVLGACRAPRAEKKQTDADRSSTES